MMAMGRLMTASALRRPLSTAAKSYTERMVRASALHRPRSRENAQPAFVPLALSPRAQDATGRPVSPHVFIYKFPTIAISSITVRITGCFLTIGASGIAGMALFGGNDAPGDLASSLASSSVAPLAKFGVGFTLVYHYLGACRHTIWDKTAKGFSNAQMLQSSYVLGAASLAISLGLAAYSLPPKPAKKE